MDQLVGYYGMFGLWGCYGRIFTVCALDIRMTQMARCEPHTPTSRHTLKDGRHCFYQMLTCSVEDFQSFRFLFSLFPVLYKWHISVLVFVTVTKYKSQSNLSLRRS